PANTHLILDHKEAISSSPVPASTPDPLFTNRSLFPQQPVHQENTFNDFDHERLLPHMLSTEGPRMLKADINGNGKQEILLLGAMDQPDQMWQQNTRGELIPMEQAAFADHAGQESTCGVFFDSDGDGDKDLLIGAGGNELQKGIEAYLLRYFENDGTGQFSLRADKTPPAGGQVSCIRAADIDGDGDEDLFIGGRAVPGNYGLPPRSFLFRNDNGIWTPVTSKIMGGMGMVTDAAFADVNGDKALDLVVVGEWMPVTVFLNQNGAFDKPYAIKESEGWWNRIEQADLDGDGDQDFVLGNWGHNMKLQASPDRPVELYVKDFDANKKSDFLLNWYPPLDEASYPFAGKLDLQAQLPHLKKRMVKFEDYAHHTYESLLNEEERQQALYYKAETMSSSVLWQEDGTLRLEPLPDAAQIAPTFGICIQDLDQDGRQDLILGGNFFGLKPEVGRFDAHRGLVLMGTPDQTFAPLNPSESGLWWEGEVRDLLWLDNIGTHGSLLVARNDAEMLSYPLSTRKSPVAQVISPKGQ
ncbi:MAG: VCBS repeat-containing protein, partial [Bacteroidota bacterium]